jgi:hypothetical protein
MPEKTPERAAAPADEQLSKSLDVGDQLVELGTLEAKDFIEWVTRGCAEFVAFEYTEVQWAEIVRSLQHLQPNEEDLGKARRRLGDAARRYRLQKVNAAGDKTRQRWFARDWARIVKLSDELMRLLHRRSNLEEEPPHPNGEPPADPWREHQEALMKLNFVARASLAASNDDGFPKASWRAWYQFDVLETWTRLGGKLQFSRHPQKHKITGPLARYFSAVTQPMLGGSLESLPDIVKRHKAMALALNRWRETHRCADAP